MKNIVLICLPFAGGSAYELTNHLRAINKNYIKCIGIDYPGHGEKISQPLISNPDKLIENLSIEIHNYILNSNVYLLGYSMGASLIPGILEFLKVNYQQQPKGVILCSAPSPKLNNKNKLPTSEIEITNYMRDNGATPQEVLDNKELMSIFIPIMKSDLKLLNKLKSETAITIPTEIIIGNADIESMDSIKYWEKKAVTSTVRILNGDHFFLYQCPEAFANEVCNFIQKSESSDHN